MKWKLSDGRQKSSKRALNIQGTTKKQTPKVFHFFSQQPFGILI